jgi:hypothetical protein
MFVSGHSIPGKAILLYKNIVIEILGNREKNSRHIYKD